MTAFVPTSFPPTCADHGRLRIELRARLRRRKPSLVCRRGACFPPAPPAPHPNDAEVHLGGRRIVDRQSAHRGGDDYPGDVGVLHLRPEPISPPRPSYGYALVCSSFAAAAPGES